MKIPHIFDEDIERIATIKKETGACRNCCRAPNELIYKIHEKDSPFFLEYNIVLDRKRTTSYAPRPRLSRL